MSATLAGSYDVVVIGAGPAGLNGALILARSRRSVLVVDAGEPRNLPAEGVHGLLGHEGLPPTELLERGRAEIRSYGGEITDGRVSRVRQKAERFIVELEDGRSLEPRQVLVATGLVDELPDVPGIRELWGHDVLHCPYCHGWEVRDRAIGILASGSSSVHQALLFRQLSDDIVFFSHKTSLEEELTLQLRARSIRIVDDEVSSLEVDDGRLARVRLHDGSAIEREVLAVSTRLIARADFLADLGLRPIEHSSGFGQHIEVDNTGQTEVPGVWAAGNITDPAAQVGGSAAAGALAAIRMNADMVEEETRRAVKDYKERSLTQSP